MHSTYICIILHIAEQLSDLFVESLSDTAERETRSQLAALNNYPGRRKKIDGHISNNNYAYDELVASTTTSS